MGDERKEGVRVPLSHRDREQLGLVSSLNTPKHPLLGCHPLPAVVFPLGERRLVDLHDGARTADLGLALVVQPADLAEEAETE